MGGVLQCYRYGCGVQVLTVKSALDVSDSGRYCCLLDIDSVETTHCIDIGVRPKRESFLV